MGIFYALLSAFIWGVNGIVVRIGVRDVDPQAAALVSVIPGVAMMGLISLAVDDLSTLGNVPWLALAVLGAAGIIAFTIARNLYYFSVRRIGASRTAVFLAARVIVAPVLGVLVLSEPLTLRVVLGGLMMFVGFSILVQD